MTNKKLVKWLPLDVDALDDPKVMALVMALGMEGFGIYLMLLMYLTKEEPTYKLTVDYLKVIAFKNHISEEKIKAVVAGFGLFENDGDLFYSHSLIRRMEGYDNIKIINKEKADKRWKKYRELCSGNAPALPEQSHKRREEKNREDNNIKEKKRIEKSENIAPADFSFVDESFLPAWGKWIAYKQELKDPYKTISGAKTQYNHLISLSGGDAHKAMKIVDQSIAGEWKGLFALKIERQDITTGEDPIDKGIREVKAAREARLKREAQERNKLLEDIEYETMLDNVKDGDKE